jgi:hypothetical protein
MSRRSTEDPPALDAEQETSMFSPEERGRLRARVRAARICATIALAVTLCPLGILGAYVLWPDACTPAPAAYGYVYGICALALVIFCATRSARVGLAMGGTAQAVSALLLTWQFNRVDRLDQLLCHGVAATAFALGVIGIRRGESWTVGTAATVIGVIAMAFSNWPLDDTFVLVALAALAPPLLLLSAAFLMPRPPHGSLVEEVFG